jgi:MarR family 2-MHQ and catechol resistance regulon transcriptional repressor
MPKAVDANEDCVLNRLRVQSSQYREFHWPSVEALVNLVQTCDTIQTYLSRSLAGQGISLAALNVLMMLGHAEDAGCPMRELVALLLVSRANVTGLVDSLERKRLVQRVPEPADRRVRRVRITEAGRNLLDATAPLYYARVRELLKEVKDSDKKTLSNLLIKLRRSVEHSSLDQNEGLRK